MHGETLMNAGKNCFYIVVVLALLVALAAGPAAAVDTTLPDVSVSATRSEQAMVKLPTNVTLITRAQIEAINPLTVPDLLRSVEGLIVRDFTGTGASASIDMRGFGETGNLHTVVTVDGRRMNQIDLSGVDFTTIPVENIERIEILHGPAGVLYGDGAVGGVINIITKEGAKGLAGKVGATYGAYRMWGGKANLSGGTDKVSFFASTRYDNWDGYRDNSETKIASFTFNVRYAASETYSFLFDGDVSRAKYNLPGSLSQAEMDADRRQSNRPDDWAENTDSHLRGQLRADWGPAGVFTFDLSYRMRKAESEIWSALDADIGIWALQPKYVVDFKLGSMGNRVTMGIDYYLTDMTSDTHPFDDSGDTSVDYKLSSLGFYALNELSLATNLILSFGGRYQMADYDIDIKQEGMPADSDTFNDKQYAFSVGLTYVVAPQSKVFARVSRAFRYPTVEEYVTYGAFMNLDPEKIMSYEVGGAYSFGQGGKLTLSAFLMNLKDEIAYNQLTYQNENLEDTRHAGVELSLRIPLWAGAHLFGNLSYVKAEFTAGPYDGNRIPLVPEFKGAAGLSATVFKGFTAVLLVDYAGSRFYGGDKDNAFAELDPYTTVGLRLRYDYKNFGFFLNANNILGEKYCTYAYAGSWGNAYYPEPEQVVWGGVEVKF